ncbi:MAG: hypothetical protein KAR73_01105 [Spirochaetales bacterium]|nr:hypothetical protein [Spirochaetales bacterium]
MFFASGRGEVRFSALKTRLAPITPRTLSEELKKLTEASYGACSTTGSRPTIC